MLPCRYNWLKQVFTQFKFNCRLCHCHLTPTINGIVVCSTINPFQYAFSEWSPLPLGASLMTHHVHADHLQIIFRMRLKPEGSSRMTWWDVKTNTKQKTTFTDLAFKCLPDPAILDGMCVKNINDLKWNTHIRNVCTKVNITLRFLRRTLFSCTQDVKEAAYS